MLGTGGERKSLRDYAHDTGSSRFLTFQVFLAHCSYTCRESMLDLLFVGWLEFAIFDVRKMGFLD